MAQGYGSFLVNQPGREEGGAAANSTLPSGGPSAPQFSVPLSPPTHTHTHLRATPACISAYLSLTRSAGQI